MLMAVCAARPRFRRRRRDRVVLLVRGVWSGFGLALRILQRPELGGNAAGNGSGLAGVLKASKIGPVAPCERTAQPLAGAKRRVVNDVDQPLVVGRALLVAGKIT